MVKLTDLEVGDKVEIVTEHTCDVEGFYYWNCSGKMDCWMGKMMTVAHVYSTYAEMEEDNGKWCWTPEMIDCVISEDATYGLFERPDIDIKLLFEN